MNRTILATFFALALGACTHAPPRTTAASANAGQAALAQIIAGYPASNADFPTTAAELYLSNLEGRIETLEQRLAQRDDPPARAALAGAVYQRFRIDGRLADSDRALELIDQAIASGDDKGDAHQFRASVLASLHRFTEAESELELAQQRGVRPNALAESRREIDLALGRYDRLADAIAHSQEPATDFYELAFRANLRVQLGDLNGASFLYREAQQAYGDVSPVPLAWLYAQQGIALVRFGHYEAAERFLKAALDRLPSYALAREHLAECEWRLGRLDSARALYRAVIDATENPEYIGALARVERSAGDLPRAAELEAQARTGYTALLSRHRAAYAQHAAEFYLDAGQAEEALPLARENLALRSDVMSSLLLARAAGAAGATTEACAARARVLATPLKPPELKQIESLEHACADL